MAPARHGVEVARRVEQVLDAALDVPVDVLDDLPVTLLHGDVHDENVLVDGDSVQLIDWGSARGGACCSGSGERRRPRFVVEAWVNGTAASPDLLTPGWTSYEWRVR